jgi:hypothetical protein
MLVGRKGIINDGCIDRRCPLSRTTHVLDLVYPCLRSHIRPALVRKMCSVDALDWTISDGKIVTDRLRHTYRRLLMSRDPRIALY